MDRKFRGYRVKEDERDVTQYLSFDDERDVKDIAENSFSTNEIKNYGQQVRKSPAGIIQPSTMVQVASGLNIRIPYSKRSAFVPPIDNYSNKENAKPERERERECRLRGGENKVREDENADEQKPVPTSLAELEALEREFVLLTLNRKSYPQQQNSYKVAIEASPPADKIRAVKEVSTPIPPPLPSQPKALFSCSICGAKFRIKSLLGAHKRCHEQAFKDRGQIRKSGHSNITVTDSHQCRYCDKKFELERTLHIHQLSHCTKIPPAEKRKLEYTELNHVQKAPLPTFSSTPSTARARNIFLESKTKTPLRFIDTKKRLEIVGPNRGNYGKMLATPNQIKTKPKPKTIKNIKIPSVGLSRISSKLIPCHLCKETFDNVLDFTEHTMNMHTIKNKY